MNRPIMTRPSSSFQSSSQPSSKKWIDKISIETYKKMTLGSLIIAIILAICFFIVAYKVMKAKKQITDFSSQLKNEIGNRSQLVGKFDSTLQSLQSRITQQQSQQSQQQPQQQVQTQLYTPDYPTQQMQQQMQMQQQQQQPQQSQNGLVFEETKRGGSSSQQKTSSMSSAGSSPFQSLGMSQDAMGMDFGEGIMI